MSIKDRVANIDVGDDDEVASRLEDFANTLEMLQEALGMTNIEWDQIISATSASECESLLFKHLGLTKFLEQE